MVGAISGRKSGFFLGAMALVCTSAFLLVGLFQSALYFILPVTDYLVVHTLLEFGSALVSFSVFLVIWEVRHQEGNTRSLFIATGFLAVAVIDIMHLLSYNGMPDFMSANSVSKAAQYWMIARLWAAFVVLVGAFVPRGAKTPFLNAKSLLLLNLGVAGASLVAVSFFPTVVPEMFASGQGLTPLKIALEYLVICMNLVAIAAYWRTSLGRPDAPVLLLMAALLVSVFSEMAFTLYASAYDTYNLLGHLFKVGAYFLLFRSLFATSVRHPYTELAGAYADLELASRELNQHNQELAALNSIGYVTSQTLVLERILNNAIEKLVDLFGMTGGAVFLADESRRLLHLKAYRGMPSFYVDDCVERPFSAGEGVIGAVLEKGEPLLIEDYANDGRVQRKAMQATGFKTFVAIPLSGRGRVIGVLALASHEQRRLATRTVDFMIAVANQLALAIENAKLYEETDDELKRRVLELEAAATRGKFLGEATRLFNSSLRLEEVLQIVTKKATDVFGELCGVFLLDETTKTLQVEALYSRQPGTAEATLEALAQVPPQLGVGIIGQVADTGKSILVKEPGTGQLNAEQRVYIDQLGIRSTLAVPLVNKGKIIGVLSSSSFSRSTALDEEHLSLAENLAGRASAAIENATLYEEALKERSRSAAITEASGDGILVVDGSHTVVTVNPALEAMLGVSAQEMVGQRCNYLLGAKLSDGSSICDTVCPLLNAEKNTHKVVESILPTRDNGGVWVGIAYGVLKDDDGNINGVVHTIRDISARKEAERLKNDFTASISHELKTPLTAIIGYSDLLLKGIPDKLTTDQAIQQQAIRRSALRLLALINDLLDVSKLEEGKVTLALSTLDIGVEIRRALMDVEVMAGSKGVALVTDFQPGLPPVMADQERLHDIISNLIANAIKFTPPGGTVTLTCGLEDEIEQRGENVSAFSQVNDGNPLVLVKVADTGIGIYPDKLGLIWDRFYQVKSSASRKFGGTGLGLAIVKSLVELHGGSVRAESDGPNKGSTFAFTLPIASQVE